MGIRFTCSCGDVVAAKDEYAGQTVRCPHCDQTIKVPDPDEVSTEDGATGASTSEMTPCPNCGMSIPSEVGVCPHCSNSVETSQTSGTGALEGEENASEERPGIFGLCRSMLIHPVRTMGTLLYHLRSYDMLLKTALLYLGSLVILSALSASADQPVFQTILRNVLHLVILSVVVSTAGQMIGGGANWLGMMAMFMFIYGFTNSFLLLVLLGSWLGLVNQFALGWIFLTFGLWRLFLYFLALMKAFGIQLYVAFFIALIAGMITNVSVASLLP